MDKEQNGERARAHERLPALDGVRACAVLIVIYFHYWQNFSGRPGVLGSLAKAGQTGVHLFFVLSGFLITGILLDSKGGAHAYLKFYMRRFLRIFPLYYAALALIFVLLPLLGLAPHLSSSRTVWFWLYAQNIPQSFFPSLAVGPGHFWTLAVEEQFYLLWPLIVFSVSPKGLARIIVAGLGVAVAMRILLGTYSAYFTLTQMDGLLMGSGLALFARSASLNARSIPQLVKMAALTVLPVLAGCGLLMGFRGGGIKPFVATGVACFYTLMLGMVASGRVFSPIHTVLSSRPLGLVGKISYGMYVIHPFIIEGLRRSGLRFSVIGLGIVLLLTYIAAMLSWHLYEKQFLRLKKHFEYSWRASV